MNNRIWESEGKKTLVSTQKNILFEGRRLTRLVSLGSFKIVSMASWVISAQEAASTGRGGRSRLCRAVERGRLVTA